jgi:hypothetical protein
MSGSSRSRVHSEPRGYPSSNLVSDLSMPWFAPAGRKAAEQAVASDRLEEMFAESYPAFLRHGTLSQAFFHLIESGADLDRLSIAALAYRRTHPLNRILGAPTEDQGDRISMAWVNAQLQRHSSILRTLLAEFAGPEEEQSFIILGGQGLRIACPPYERWSHDIDLAIPDVDRGLDLVNRLVNRFGFVVHRSTLSGHGKSASAIVRLVRMIDGHEVHADVHSRGDPGDESAGYVEGRDAGPQAGMIDGRQVLVLSPVDMLLRVLLRIVRDGLVTHRARNDAWVLLTGRAGPLDWGGLCNQARAAGVGGVLGHVADRIERLEGETVVPPDAREELASSLAEIPVVRWLEAAGRARTFPSGPPRKTETAFPSPIIKLAGKTWGLFRSIEEEGAHGLIQRATARTQWLIFRAQCRATRHGGAASNVVVSRPVRALRAGVLSLCEMEGTALAREGQRIGCLSRSRLPRTPLSAFDDVDQRRVRVLVELLNPVARDDSLEEGDGHLGRKLVSPRSDTRPSLPHRCEDFRWIRPSFASSGTADVFLRLSQLTSPWRST